MPNFEQNVKKMSKVDQEDFRRILKRTLNVAHTKYPNLKYNKMHSAYSKFDPARGMDYQLHLNFFDNAKREKVLKR